MSCLAMVGCRPGVRWSSDRRSITVGYFDWRSLVHRLSPFFTCQTHLKGGAAKASLILIEHSFLFISHKYIHIYYTNAKAHFWPTQNLWLIIFCWHKSYKTSLGNDFMESAKTKQSVFHGMSMLTCLDWTPHTDDLPQRILLFLLFPDTFGKGWKVRGHFKNPSHGNCPLGGYPPPP